MENECNQVGSIAMDERDETHAIDDTPDPVYWQDLDGEKLQKGDRILDLNSGKWLVVGKDLNAAPEGTVMNDWPAQRPVKINGESED